jgi:hypothetical protein
MLDLALFVGQIEVHWRASYWRRLALAAGADVGWSRGPGGAVSMGFPGHKLLVLAVMAAAATAWFAPPSASGRAAGPKLEKLGGQLRDLVPGGPGARRLRGGGATIAPVPLTVSGSGKVLVDVYVNGAMRSATAALRAEGMRVVAVSGRSPQRMVEGWLPVTALDDVAALGRTKAVLPVFEALFNTGSALSQGDAVHRGPQVRAIGYNGAGIPVGIISDSINRVGGGVAASQASGDLPPVVQVLEDGPALESSDEGRAMAEIVYDTAPGIPKILFARGGGGPAVRANNIDALVAGGAKVIADDVVYLTEPMFQDGIVAQAADRAKANGTAYLVSAGNRARQSWEGVFTPAGSAPAENDFDTSAAEDRRQTVVTMPAGTGPNPTRLTFVLDWGEPWGAAQTDFAVDFYNVSNESTPVATFDTNNVMTGIPMESNTLLNTGAAVTVSIRIRRVTGTANPRLKWIANPNFGTFTPAEHNTSSPAIDPDASSARGALAVAAVRHSDPGLNDVESFSSRGPTVTRYFSATGQPLTPPDVRAKPDIAGADGVATSVPGFSSFFGTSAAAPSAAGVAALLLSADPSLSVDELYAILRNSGGSSDCTAPGFPDADCGFGFVLADGKLAALDSTPPVIAPVLSPAAPDGANGWYRSPVGVSWNIGSRTLVASSNGCATQTVAADGPAALTCTATTAGGTASRGVTFKHDGSPPTTPVISGIGAGPFSPAALPPQNSIACSASDPTSGVDSCAVGGYSSARGQHTLTATAVNGAGLSSTATLGYTVKPLGAQGLSVPRTVRIASLLRSGLSLSVLAATDRTAVDGTLKLGKVVVGRARKTVGSGRARLRIKLNRRGRARLRRARRASLTVTLTAASPSADPVTLSRRFVARR